MMSERFLAHRSEQRHPSRWRAAEAKSFTAAGEQEEDRQADFALLLTKYASERRPAMIPRRAKERLEMPVRLQDIAKDLNLSAMTISRVLRGQTDVSAQTKARVLQRMQELKYRPNDAARGLRTGQAFRVGVLVPQISDPYFAAVCQGLATIFQGAGYGVAVATTGADPEREDAEIELQLSRQVDAVILVGPVEAKEWTGGSQDRGVPIICIGRKPPEGAVAGFGLNEPEIGRMPATYLLTRGARHIAYLRGPRTAIADDRFRGFLKAHREGGIEPHHEWAREVRSDSSDYQRGFERVMTLLQERIPPDAVMSYNDALGAGARDAALAHGLRLPDQFQVIGCGNDALLCSIGLPLTSVAFPGEELGARAARFALTLMEGNATPPSRDFLLNPSVVSRSTTRSLESRGTPKRKRTPLRSTKD